MVVNEREELITRLIFESATHKYIVNETTLAALKERKKANLEIAKHIQQHLRQIVDNSTGEFWQESFNEIFERITGQKTLPMSKTKKLMPGEFSNGRVRAEEEKGAAEK